MSKLAQKNSKLVNLIPIMFLLGAVGIIVYKNFVPNFLTNNAPDTRYRYCLQQGGDVYTCLESYFVSTLKDKGPKLALSTLAQADAESTQILSLCHPLAHRLGREAYNYFDDATKAFSVGDETCANGYYHGVLEGYLAKVPKIEDAVSSVCSSNGQISGYIYFQCVHGLGHGLMFKTDDDIAQSLGYCDLLKTQYDRESCYGGVFMQNIVNDFPYNTGHQKTISKVGDPLYPCDDDTLVPDKYKSGCYFLVTSQIIKVTGQDWSAMSSWCDKVSEKYRYLCYQSMGREASGATLRDPQRSYTACQTASPKYLGDCVTGVAKDFLEQDPRNPRSKDFCNLVEASVKPQCFRASGEMIASIYTSQNERSSACQNLTQTYLPECLLQK